MTLRRSRDVTWRPCTHATPTQANEDYFAKNGEPLFSSHMLDLSEESIEENMEISKKYLERMAKINCFLEVEILVQRGIRMVETFNIFDIPYHL